MTPYGFVGSRFLRNRVIYLPEYTMSYFGEDPNLKLNVTLPADNRRVPLIAKGRECTSARSSAATRRQMRVCRQLRPRVSTADSPRYQTQGCVKVRSTNQAMQFVSNKTCEASAFLRLAGVSGHECANKSVLSNEWLIVT